MTEVYELPLAEVEKLKKELLELQTTGRNDIAAKIKEAKSFGDLSENAEYDEAKSDQAKLEARIQEIEYILAHCTILDESALTTERVRTGLAVRVHDHFFDEDVVYYIVNAPQASPLENKISDESPVGKALIGHAVGDVVTVETPDGNNDFTILEISK
ncbi:MAG: transcription elongation factor GreA [Clostridia bacterium]|nr:transcription elongation factor GreA [Clostridia bacterium]